MKGKNNNTFNKGEINNMIQNKKRLILDFDSTMCDSISSYCKVYSTLFKNAEGFKEPNPNNVKLYSLLDECPFVENPINVFNMKLFFEYLQPFPNAVEIIEKLSEEFDIYVVSVCQLENAYYKGQYIENNFKGIKRFVPIISFDGKCEMSKGEIINSNLSICVDDNESCLFSFDESNILLDGSIPSNHNIVFGKTYDWNSHNTYQHCLDWIEVYNYIIALTRGKQGLQSEIDAHNQYIRFKNDIIYK